MVQTSTGIQRAVRTKRQDNSLTQAMQAILADLTQLPPYEEAPELYSDWGEEGEFKVEVGRGECAQ